ncbi:hypothetical protein ACRAWF_05935 [Streptomyces sp. L7]
MTSIRGNGRGSRRGGQRTERAARDARPARHRTGTGPRTLRGHRRRRTRSPPDRRVVRHARRPGRALVAYAAAPGVLGWWLARRSWEGGTRIRLGLLAVQGWLILGAVVNVTSGSARGGLQLFLPIVIVFLLFRPESRQWYGLTGLERVERRPFSLARLIRWRRDEGQTAVEYAGFIAIVAAIITALLVTGLGTQIFSGIQSEVCKVTGHGLRHRHRYHNHPDRHNGRRQARPRPCHRQARPHQR